MNYYLTQEQSDLPQLTDSTFLVVDSCSSSLTQKAATLAYKKTSIVGVIGWLDITSPNLVDLLDDVLHQPHTTKLHGLRLEAPAPLEHIPVQRGVATIEQLGLELWTEDLKLRAAITSQWPNLTVVQHNRRHTS